LLALFLPEQIMRKNDGKNEKRKRRGSLRIALRFAILFEREENRLNCTTPKALYEPQGKWLVP